MAVNIGRNTLLSQNPLDHPRLEMWIDSSTGITLTDDHVSQWNDLSGNNRHWTQATEARRPDYGLEQLNGIDLISFDDTQQHHMIRGGSACFIYPRHYTSYYLFKNGLANAGKPGLYGRNDSAVFLDGKRGVSLFGGQHYNNVTLSESFWGSSWEVISTLSSAGKQRVYKNGVLIGEDLNGATISTVYNIGTLMIRRTSDLLTPNSGQIAESMVYNARHGTNQMLALTDYLRNKWNV